MHQETASLMSLGEVDEELRKKIVADIEKIITLYLQTNSYPLSTIMVSEQQATIERLALRALKNHLNNASNIY